MKQLQETESNPSFQIESEYCQHLLREKRLFLMPEKTSEESSISVSSQGAYSLAMAQEQVRIALCSNVVTACEASGLTTSMGWRDIIPTLTKLRSSKGYSIGRTSPIINKLNQVWVLSVIGYSSFIDINRIHRTLTFDITSSDPVEDFLQIEPSGKIKETLSQLSNELIQFCSRQKILQYLPVAINLIEQSFPSIRELHMQTEEDPEAGEEWLVLNVTIQGEVDEVLNNYDTYTGHWVSSVPWPERQKIRLSYNII